MEIQIEEHEEETTWQEEQEQHDFENEMTEENDDYGFGSCPKCGSKKYVSVARGENCDDCGYFVHYP